MSAAEVFDGDGYWSGTAPGATTEDYWRGVPYEVTPARPRWWRVHNLVAHPLLVLCPPVGRWLHDRTAP